ncbi:hypothetical protein [Acinetobacter baumannii]|uniref:hypothetical protein n=1 Tax=Acinetobacter baumannii TaxID=470 RepID=UPI003A83FBA5
MSERYRVNQQHVDINVVNPRKTKVVGVENHLTNYSTFIPPEPDSPEGMFCPRKSCRRWIYRDNKECEYCKYDIQAYWYRIQQRQNEEIERQKRKNAMNLDFSFVGVLTVVALVVYGLNSLVEHHILWLQLLPYLFGMGAFLLFFRTMERYF